MRIIAFVGPSGTGKSYRSIWVAKERQIEYIIDDGLLIHGNTIVAGKSAKKEHTKISSIKTALFMERDHANSVKIAIQKRKPEGIMILGTSDGMVEKIATNLELGEIDSTVYIENVASEYEIKQALKQRKEEGKHVIPVPSFELKKDFNGYFLDPLQIFKRQGKGSFEQIGEKSVVRPTFSYLGKYSISDFALYQIINYFLLKMPGIEKVSRFRVIKRPNGIIIDMDIIMVYGFMLLDIIYNSQAVLKNEIEKFTALNVLSLNINIKTLVTKQPLP